MSLNIVFTRRAVASVILKVVKRMHEFHEALSNVRSLILGPQQDIEFPVCQFGLVDLTDLSHLFGCVLIAG